MSKRVNHNGRPSRRLSWADLFIGVALIALMGIGAYYRFVGQNWDDFTHLHPDERFLTGVATHLGDPGIWGYFDTEHSPLNPHHQYEGECDLFVYGTLPLFVTRAAADITSMVSGDPSWTGYNGIHLVGRSVSAVTELASVFVLFLLGRKLYGKWVGLLAASLAVAAVFPIQLSHYFTMDAFTNLPVLLTAYFAVLVMDEGRLWQYAFFGFFFGASIASRINVLPLFGLVLLAVAVRWWGAGKGTESSYSRGGNANKDVLGLILAGLAGFLTFRVAQPYAFAGPGFFGILPNSCWLQNLGEVMRLMSGQIEFPPNYQWVGRLAYVFPWRNMVLWGMGLPLGLTAWAGWGWAAYQTIRRRSLWKRHLLPVVWVFGYFAWQGRQWVMTMRYYMPIYPFLILLGAWALAELWGRTWRKAQRDLSSILTSYEPGISTALQFVKRAWAPIVAALLIAFVVVATHLYAFGFTRIYTRPLTRVEASRWFYRNVPGDFVLTLELPGGGQRPINIGMSNDGSFGNDPLLQNITTFRLGEERRYLFRPEADGTITAVLIPHLGDPLADPGVERFRVLISSDPSADFALGEAVIEADLSAEGGVLGRDYYLRFDPPVEVQAGGTYYLIGIAEAGGPITTAGAVVANEGPWDDPVPWSVDGIDGYGMGYYQGLELFMAREDDQEKLDTILYTLDNAEYITISSNRFYDSLSRLPARFPLSIRYYEALFSGELGYELIAEFSSFPTVGGFEIPDQARTPFWNDWEAEEAFHVYDHPLVLVFRRRPDYDPEVPRRILGSVDLNQVVRLSALEADRSPFALMLPETIWEQQRAGGTWSERFDVNSPLYRYQPLGVIVWWGLMVLFGLIAFPLLFVSLPGLPDRGYAASKALALLLIGWIPWVLGSMGLHVWNQIGVLCTTIALALAGGLIARRKWGALRAYFRSRWRYVLIVEVITLALYGYFLLVRLGNPDLWHTNFGGEKPMEFAYFNAVLKSTVFPPYDPWFAGGHINYYYFGYVIVGAPVLLLKLVPAFAYNLIVPTLFALTGIGAFAVAYNLVEGLRRRGVGGPISAAVRKAANPWVAGGAALVLAVILGNLDEIRVLIGGIARTGGWMPDEGTVMPPLNSILRGLSDLLNGAAMPVPPHHWYWNPTRVIAHLGSAINEFPYFTFLYADLHAHMIAFPLTLLVMLWALGMAQSVGHRRDRLAIALGFFTGGLTVGMLRATNTWDWLTYTLVGLAAVSYAWWERYKPCLTRVKPLAIGVAQLAAFLAISVIVVMPYTSWYASIYNSVRLWDGGKTPLWAYFDMHGIFLFLAFSFLAWETYSWLRETSVRILAGRWAVLVGLMVGLIGCAMLSVMLAVAAYPVALIALPLIVWSGLLILRPDQGREKRIALALIAAAIGLTLGVEILVLSGDVARQNTVFKFYLQAWLMLSVAGGAAFAWLLASTERWTPGLHTTWSVILAIMVAIGAMYPIMATRGKLSDRMRPEVPPPTLDGMAYMLYAEHFEEGSSFPMADDYRMIRWIQDNIVGSPVIAEGRMGEYHWGSRISIYTGLPAILGWNWHQRQQRTIHPQVTQFVWDRERDVETLYTTLDPNEAMTILNRYGVDYVIIGDLERILYPSAGLGKFEDMARAGLLEEVYRYGDNVIYRVVR